MNILSPSLSLISLATHSPTFPSHIPSSFLSLFLPQLYGQFHFLEKLPADIVEEVMDLLENVPDDNPYDRLKEAILKRTGASNEAMLRNLFTQVELGDRTPSQLLRHMRTLLGDNKMSENIMRSLWLDKLPTTTTQILAPMTEETQTEKLADIADRIHESFRSRRVNSIQPQPAQQRDREFNDLKSSVGRLSIQLQGLLQKDRQYRRDKCPGYRKRSFSRGRTDNRNRKDEICYYHKRPGSFAKRAKITWRGNLSRRSKRASAAKRRQEEEIEVEASLRLSRQSQRRQYVLSHETLGERNYRLYFKSIYTYSFKSKRKLSKRLQDNKKAASSQALLRSQQSPHRKATRKAADAAATSIRRSQETIAEKTARSYNAPAINEVSVIVSGDQHNRREIVTAVGSEESVSSSSKPATFPSIHSRHGC
ncbi:unnamed protein product [Acanthosepion pharaonis]|uniref:DUF7041 domain-containing protein n=1 Tax=Acanthosepion pharaonis TaxID=158019 RepID=A0A812CIJ8_ACAPH|nr:unnamed protein product [Sepia pharaonis]